jgi:ABC-type nitrate/sulfonate/bicarbonate transport system substrate-binding protein/outer membrane protein OmpA-like peptidoglycan-associated protein
MAERTAKGMLVAAVIWLVIIGALAIVYKFLVHPRFAAELEEETGSESRYKHEVTLSLDSFSGYCIIRSQALEEQLKNEGIRLKVVDDGANTGARIRAIQNGEAQFAVFTIDSLITSGAALGEFPATIIMVIDETRGADAIIAKKGAVTKIQDLDSPDARIVLTPNSPSEFLARIVLAHFSLPNLPDKWWVEADGAADVYRQFLSAGEDEKKAYVLWEPYVSKAVDDGARVLLDSSKLTGYIVDVLAVRRQFLRDNPDVVRSVVQAYLRTAYSYGRQEGGMARLVREDARAAGGEELDEAQAQKLVAGIQWKSTLENYAHFGLLSQQESGGAPHLEDMIANIANVLGKTGAIEADPLAGKASTLFFSGTLSDMKNASFHPSKKLALIEDVGAGIGELDKVRTDAELAKLSDEQWGSLVPVGELSAKPIAFARGTARINLQSQRELARLARLLESWPQYYLLVVGHARAEGDPEANMRLAMDRANAATAFLAAEGISENRIRAKAGKPSSRGGAAQSVSFTLGQLPY